MNSKEDREVSCEYGEIGVECWGYFDFDSINTSKRKGLPHYHTVTLSHMRMPKLGKNHSRWITLDCIHERFHPCTLHQLPSHV